MTSSRPWPQVFLPGGECVRANPKRRQAGLRTKTKTLGSQAAWVQVLIHTAILLNFSGSQGPHQWDGTGTPSASCYEDR